MLYKILTLQYFKLIDDKPVLELPLWTVLDVYFDLFCYSILLLNDTLEL